MISHLLWWHIECLCSHVYLLVHVDARNDKKYLGDNYDEVHDADDEYIYDESGDRSDDGGNDDD